MPHKVARELEMKPSKLHGLGKQKLRTIGSTEKLKVHKSTKGLHLSLFFTKKKIFLAPYFSKTGFFFKQFEVQSKTEQKYRELSSHVSPAPTHAQPPPAVNSPHQSGTLVTMDEPTLTHHNHPKPPVYLRFTAGVGHSFGFGEIEDDLYLPLENHRVVSLP